MRYRSNANSDLPAVLHRAATDSKHYIHADTVAHMHVRRAGFGRADTAFETRPYE